MFCRCRGSLSLLLSLFSAAIPAVVSRHSLHNHNSLSLSLSPFAATVPVDVYYRARYCSWLLPSLPPFATAVLLAFAISQDVLSLPWFAIIAPLTVLCRHPCRRFRPWSLQPPFARRYCGSLSLLLLLFLPPSPPSFPAMLTIAVPATIRYLCPS